jgi:hypothetical protein
VNLHAWPDGAKVRDQQAHEFLALFEVQAVNALSNTPDEGFTLRDNRLLMASSWCQKRSRSCSNCRWRLMTS